MLRYWRATGSRGGRSSGWWRGACDFVADVALGYPLHVIMDILAMPEQEEPRMLNLTQELFGPQELDAAQIRDALR